MGNRGFPALLSLVAINAPGKEELCEGTLRHFVILRPCLSNLHDVRRQLDHGLGGGSLLGRSPRGGLPCEDVCLSRPACVLGRFTMLRRERVLILRKAIAWHTDILPRYFLYLRYRYLS